MVAIRPLEEIKKKWTDVTPQRQPYFEAGVRNPMRDWASNALAAEPAWIDGVTQAASEKRFGKGVKKAGTPKWQRKTLAVVNRFGEGVRLAGDDYAAGFAPFHEEIAKITLPPRGARGDPRNYDRVRTIGDALHKKRLALLKGGGGAS